MKSMGKLESSVTQSVIEAFLIGFDFARANPETTREEAEHGFTNEILDHANKLLQAGNQ